MDLLGWQLGKTKLAQGVGFLHVNLHGLIRYTRGYCFVSFSDYLVYAAYGDCTGIIIIICLLVRKKERKQKADIYHVYDVQHIQKLSQSWPTRRAIFFLDLLQAGLVMLLRAQFHRLLAYLSCDEKDQLARSHQLAPSTPVMSSSVGEKTTACVTGGSGYVASALIKTAKSDLHALSSTISLFNVHACLV